MEENLKRVRFIYKLQQCGRSDLRRDKEAILLDPPSQQQEIQYLEALRDRGIDIVESEEGRLKIPLRLEEHSLRIFYDRQHLFQSLKQFHLESFDIAILHFDEDKSFFFDRSSGEKIVIESSSDETQPAPNETILDNAIYYDRILEFLRKESSFATYDDTPNRTILIVSGERGALQIRYPLDKEKPVIDSRLDLKQAFVSLQDKFLRKDFIPFFKEELYDRLKNESDEERRFVVVVENMVSLLEAAERNLEVYLRDFSFEKIRSQLREERAKYFLSSKETLGKLNSQAVSTIVSASAAVVAVYGTNAPEEPLTAFIITFSYVVYSAFNTYSLKIVSDDVKDLRDEFDADMARIKKRSQLIYDSLKEESDQIRVRIRKLGRLVSVFILMITSLNLIVIFYILSQTPSISSFLQAIMVGIGLLVYVLIWRGVI